MILKKIFSFTILLYLQLLESRDNILSGKYSITVDHGLVSHRNNMQYYEVTLLSLAISTDND